MIRRSWSVAVLAVLLATGAWGGFAPAAAVADPPIPETAHTPILETSHTPTPEAAHTPIPETAHSPIPEAAYDGVDVDRVLLAVDLREDGSAHWRIEHRVRLDDPNATQGFERTRGELRANRSAFREPFADRIRAMATTAQAETGRAMVVENVSVEAYRERIPQEYGVVAYEFRWYGFAETDDELRAGDALSGLFLDEETTLLIGWPSDAEPVELAPEPDESRDAAAVWHGPLEFASGEPRVVLESASLSFGPDFTAPRSTDAFVTLAAFGVVLGSLGTVVVWRRRRGTRAAGGEADAAETDAAERASATAGRTPDAAGRASGARFRDGARTPASDAVAAGSESDGVSASPDSDYAPARPNSADPDSADAPAGSASPDAPAGSEALLSNEERVLRLLDERGGRMKQQDVVAALEWSETKTSEVVGELREADAVDVYRLGRENVLALPEVGLGIAGESADEPDGDRE